MAVNNLERVVALAVAEVKAPQFQAMHAALARTGLAKHLAQTQGQPRMRRIVDGNPGAPEDSVKYLGIIRYEFDSLVQAALWAKGQLEVLSPVSMSPVSGGRYRDSWFLMVDGQQVEPDAVPVNARDIMIVNDQPYSRKLVAGKKRDGRPFSLQNLPPGFLTIVEYSTRARYRGALLVKGTFTMLTGGHRLRNDYRTTDIGRVRPRNRAGSAITYPALYIEIT